MKLAPSHSANPLWQKKNSNSGLHDAKPCTLSRKEQEQTRKADISRHSRESAKQRPEEGKEKHLPPFACLYSNVEKIILGRCLEALHLRKMHGIKFLKS